MGNLKEDEIKKVNHIAAILDGNRRYARAQAREAWRGHEDGANKVEEFLRWCREFDIKEVTLYVLSTENLKREKKELDTLFDLSKKFFKKFMNSKEIKDNKVKIKFIGDLALLPEDVRRLAIELESKTRDYENYTLNFCFAYGGRLELTQAFNKLIREGKKEINEEDITRALWLSSEPDLIIRTGNSQRTSNFLPWQAVYSEWIFLEKMWPEFTKEDLDYCLEEFRNRKRNFGK